MKIPYSHDYFPPAPVLIIGLAAPEQSPLVESQPALVDTGADGTFVPTSLLERLDTPPAYSTNVRAHFGDSLLRVSVHKIDILFGAIRLPDLEVVSDDWGAEIILGRNVLNKLRLLLDGPRQTSDLD
jgi:predicted aspartyl protease